MFSLTKPDADSQIYSVQVWQMFDQVAGLALELVIHRDFAFDSNKKRSKVPNLEKKKK